MTPKEIFMKDFECPSNCKYNVGSMIPNQKGTKQGYVCSCICMKAFIAGYNIRHDINYFYCKYGGILEICSHCKRNIINSNIRKEIINTWFEPNTHPKHCNDYIPMDKDCSKCTNSKGCITCTNRDQYTE